MKEIENFLVALMGHQSSIVVDCMSFRFILYEMLKIILLIKHFFFKLTLQS